LNAYLSIDLDYWRYEIDARRVNRFFDRVFGLGLPIFVAALHDQLLPEIDKSGCDTIINVDAHSDLADLPEPGVDMLLDKLNEGTWGNFISWKARGRFIWRYPDKRHIFSGFCHEGRFEGDETNPLVHPELAGWRSTAMQHGLGKLPWRSLRAVGVSLSAYWVGAAPIQAVTDRLRISQWRRLPERLHRQTLRPFLWTPT
jgi:hypothetical protein